MKAKENNDEPENDTSFVPFKKLQPISVDIERNLEQTDLLNYP